MIRQLYMVQWQGPKKGALGMVCVDYLTARGSMVVDLQPQEQSDVRFCAGC
jgi:hypothetical protein